MSTEVNPSTHYFNHKHRIVEVNVELQKAMKEDYERKKKGTFKIESSLLQANMSIEDIINGINNGDENEIFTATHAVTILTRNFYPVIDILINANVVPKLVEFLSRDSNPDLQLESAWALAHIASGTSDQVEAVVSAGAVASFISLLGSPHPVLSEIAVWTLGNIARNDLELTNHVIEQGIIEPLLIFINKHDTSATLLRSVTCTLSKMCSSIEYDHPNWCMEEGPTFPGLQQLLPALAHLIQNNDGEILADTCEALSSIVFECNEQRAQEVADAGVLPRLVALLDRHEVAIIIPALHTIADVLSASDQAKVIISAGGVAKLTSLLEPRHPDVAEEDHVPLVGYIFRHLCRYLNPTDPTVQQLLPALFHLIYKNDKHVLPSACMALCYLTVTNDVVKEVVDAGVVPRLVTLLDNNDASVSFPALRTIGNIVTGIQTMVAGAYPLLAKLLIVNSSTKTFWYEATVFASQIADCNAAQTQDLITSNVILPLVDVLSQGDFKRQKETALVISNITLGSNVVKTAMLFQFEFASLCTLMCILLCTLLCTLLKATEPKTIVVVLDGLALILEASKKMGDLEKVSLHVNKCGGLDCIKALKSNENVEIHHKSLAILERYFPTDLSEDVPS